MSQYKGFIGDFWDKLSLWSQETFGKDKERGPVGALEHLKKEAQEAINDPCDLIEYADCMFLILDATRRAGFGLNDLIDAMYVKLAINKVRPWPKPSADKPVEHKR